MGVRNRTYVALLRGINVSGQHAIPMAALRGTCASIGFDRIRTYIQSGNVVFACAVSEATAERRLEAAVERDYGHRVPVIVRSAAHWARFVEGMPFPDGAEREGSRVLLVVAKRPPAGNAAAELQQRATAGERVVGRGDALWIHFPQGIGRSKLTPAVLDRCLGSPATARNRRTVLKLHELMRP
jgi:uncharacterized protein (DUF1697 family)